MALVDKISEILHVGIETVIGESWTGIVPLDYPDNETHGDFASPVAFILAKKYKRDPQSLAKKIAEYLNTNLSTLELKDLNKKEGWHPATDIIERFEAVGSFINIWLAQDYLVGQAVAVVKQNSRYGRLPVPKESRPVIVEYSSINVGKPMSVGHLRSTVIGDALANIMEATGHKVVRINYLGDWGTQFGKLIVAYNKWGRESSFKKDPTREMLRVYVKFNNELKKDPKLAEEARAHFKKLEDGDARALKMWGKFRKATLKAAGEIYDLLGVKFDEITGESAYRGDLSQLLKLLRAKKLLKKSQGARIVDLEKEGLPPLIIQKKDTAGIYASRELAAAIDRYRKFKFSHMFYEVGAEQELHFKQIISVLDKMGYSWAERIEHIKHGLYTLKGQKMSTRAGSFFSMRDLLDEAVKRAYDIVNEKSPELKNKKQVARAVGIGAVKYSDLSQSRLTGISFDFERMLSLEGNSAPYLQYTYARTRSVLRKGLVKSTDLLAMAGRKNKLLAYTAQSELKLLRRLTRYPQTLLEAAQKRMPHLLATELFAVAGLFNLFYAKQPILKARSPELESRLILTAATGVIISNGLMILGIDTPKRL